jgi:predicted DNA-binding transcriptional regulator YafY
LQIDRLITRIGADIGKTRTAVTSSFRRLPRPRFVKPDIKHLLHAASKRERKIALICSAIRSRRIIEFYYHGGCRTVEPFCLGTLMSRFDNVSLLCYRTGGLGDTREAFGWKLYRLSQMKNIRVLDEQFSGLRDDYSSRKAGMVTVYCSVLPPSEDVIEKAESTTVSHDESMRRFRFRHTAPRKN